MKCSSFLCMAFPLVQLGVHTTVVDKTKLLVWNGRNMYGLIRAEMY